MFNRVIKRSMSTAAKKVIVAPDAKLTPEVIQTIQATAPVVAAHVKEITSTFYKTMFTNNPEVVPFFNQTHQKDGLQQTALADAVVAYATNIDNLGVLGDAVGRMAHRHCALSIVPEQYPVVHDNLMKAVGAVLGDAVTPEIANAWSQSVLVLANILVDAEEKLYQELETREGGWRKETELELVEKTKVADDVVRFGFKKPGYNGKFAFEAGQYLTLRAPTVNAPRHYTVTSQPGAEVLEITARILPGGKMTTYLNDNLNVGDKIKAAAPCGVFKTDKAAGKNIMISAGIGLTPMWAFVQELGPSKVSSIYHVEKSKSRHALREEMEKTGVASKFVYTSETGRPDLAKDMKELVEKNGKDAAYYLCAPATFIQDAEAALRENGAENVNTEMFGTGVVARKCPVDH